MVYRTLEMLLLMDLQICKSGKVNKRLAIHDRRVYSTDYG